MGLNDMNGRIQDAVTGRFLSPDPTIPDPGFTQSYNRYSYVNNSPLTLADPSGFDPCGTSGDTVVVCGSFFGVTGGGATGGGSAQSAGISPDVIAYEASLIEEQAAMESVTVTGTRPTTGAAGGGNGSTQSQGNLPEIQPSTPQEVVVCGNCTQHAPPLYAQEIFLGTDDEFLDPLERLRLGKPIDPADLSRPYTTKPEVGVPPPPPVSPPSPPWWMNLLHQLGDFINHFNNFHPSAPPVTAPPSCVPEPGYVCA